MNGKEFTFIYNPIFKVNVWLYSICIWCISSCTKMVIVNPPGDQIESSVVFKDVPTATAAVVGIYNNMMVSNSQITNGGLSIYSSVSADELIPNAPSADLAAIYTNNISISSGINNAYWQRMYNFIYQANAIIEGVNGSGFDGTTKNQLIGEAKFVRAFCYFYLSCLYGDVPLELSTDYRVNMSMARTPKADVWLQIEKDLQDAQNSLPTSYPTTGRVRPNKWTATALLARLYLYEQKWTSAETQATAIINSGMYSLGASLTTIFGSASSEAIWQLMPTVASSNTAEGNIFIPSNNSVVPAYYLASFLLNAFDSKDKRRTSWVRSNTINGVTYNYPYKYTIKSSTTVTEYNMVFRLSEQYLIRSEARGQQNNIVGASSDLNMIRKRAGTDTLSAAVSKDQCIDAIYKERQLELFTEWGHRWFDLIRTGKIDSVLNAEKPGWRPTAALFPIPNSEILANPFLTPNPGY